MDRYQTVVIEARQRELLRDAEHMRWAARIHRRTTGRLDPRVLTPAR